MVKYSVRLWLVLCFMVMVTSVFSQDYKSYVEAGIIFSILAYQNDLSGIDNVASDIDLSLEYQKAKLVALPTSPDDSPLNIIVFEMDDDFGEAILSFGSPKTVLGVKSFMDSFPDFFAEIEKLAFIELGIPEDTNNAYILQYLQGSELYAVCVVLIDLNAGKIIFSTYSIDERIKLINATKFIFREYLKE